MENKYKSVPVLSSEITPKSLYLNRRDFLRTAGILTGSALLAACAPSAGSAARSHPEPCRGLRRQDRRAGSAAQLVSTTSPITTTTMSSAPPRTAVAPLSANFKIRPWSVDGRRDGE